MKQTIQQRLRQIERNESVRILYACESGSQAWGFASTDSDYDVRFIYVRPRDWYLRVDLEQQRDVIELPIDDLLDINGWDLKKALKLFYKSNPALIEWLHSPIVYQADTSFLDALKALLPEYYSPRACFYHYSHMAKGNFREYLQGEQVRIKKYFYVLRPLLAMRWIAQGRGVAPIRFDELVSAMVTDTSLLRDIEQLLEAKKQGFESDYQPRIESISRFVEQELQTLQQQDLPRPQPAFDQLNQLFLDTLASWQ